MKEMRILLLLLLSAASVMAVDSSDSDDSVVPSHSAGEVQTSMTIEASSPCFFFLGIAVHANKHDYARIAASAEIEKIVCANIFPTIPRICMPSLWRFCSFFVCFDDCSCRAG